MSGDPACFLQLIQCVVLAGGRARPITRLAEKQVVALPAKSLVASHHDWSSREQPPSMMRWALPDALVPDHGRMNPGQLPIPLLSTQNTHARSSKNCH